MRLIEINPERHLLPGAFDEVTLRGGRITFSFGTRQVAVVDFGRSPSGVGADTLPHEARTHSQGEYARLVEWLSRVAADIAAEDFMGFHGMAPAVFRFAELPKGPDSNAVAVETCATFVGGSLCGKPVIAFIPRLGVHVCAHCLNELAPEDQAAAKVIDAQSAPGEQVFA